MSNLSYLKYKYHFLQKFDVKKNTYLSHAGLKKCIKADAEKKTHFFKEKQKKSCHPELFEF